MPDKILNAGSNYYHAISSKFLNRPVSELLEVGGHDRGQGWASERRFAHPSGGKYFSDSPAGAIAEIQARFSESNIKGLPASDILPYCIFEIFIEGNQDVLSVTLALADIACRDEFVKRYNVEPTDTVDKADRHGSRIASRIVASQLDRNLYAGIEYPSVRLAGASNVVFYCPLSVIDLLQLSDTPFTTYLPSL